VEKPSTDKAKELVKEFSTPARQLTSVQNGRTILEPLIYEDRTLFHQFHELKLQSRIRQILRSAMEAKIDVNLEDVIAQAAMDLGLSKTWVDKYFKSTRYQKWVADRMKEIEDHTGLSIEYLASKHKDNLEGTLKLTASQLDSAKELGDRIWPKVSKIEHEISQKEAVTLDDMPDYQKKVEELEQKFKEAMPPTLPPNAAA